MMKLKIILLCLDLTGFFYYLFDNILIVDVIYCTF